MSAALPTAVVRAMFLRSFAIQGSWNYRTLQGTGFAYALLPALRHICAGDESRLQDAVQRHSSLFNAHPYLAGVAIGAVARMEADHEDPALIDRFKTALRGSLGTLGDRLVWAGWRPACVLLAIVALLATRSVALAVLTFLLVYNIGHLALRWWCLHVGLAHGRHVGERLRHAPLLHMHDRVVLCASFLVGTLLPLGAAGAFTNTRVAALWLAVPAAAAIAGWMLGVSARTPVIVFLAIVAIAGLLLPVSS